MKKLLVLAVAIVFTMALVAPAVAAVVEKETVTVVADNDKKETKKECKDADKKAACTDKKADAKACTDKKAEAKACTGEKSAEAKKACCGEKKAEKK